MSRVSHFKTFWLHSKPQMWLVHVPGAQAHCFSGSRLRGRPLPQEATVGERLGRSLLQPEVRSVERSHQLHLPCWWNAPWVAQGFVPVKLPLPTRCGACCHGKLIQAPLPPPPAESFKGPTGRMRAASRNGGAMLLQKQLPHRVCSKRSPL